MDCLAVFNSESKKYDVTVKWREEPSVIQAISYMYIRVLSPMFAISVGSKVTSLPVSNSFYSSDHVFMSVGYATYHTQS